MTSLTITARQLRNLVTPIYPHAGADGTYPVLEHIRIWTTKGHVCAWATDRFTFGITRDELDGAEPGFETFLTVATLKQILTIFKTTRTADPVLTIESHGDNTVTVEAADGLFDSVFASARLEVNAGAYVVGQAAGGNGPHIVYPDLRKLVEAADGLEPDGNLVAFNPSLMARFAAAQRHGDPLVARAHPRKLTLVACGDHFLGGLMPVNPDTTGSTLAARLDGNRWLDVFEAASLTGARA